MKTLLQKLFPFEELKETAARFPLSVFCALALFGLMVLLNHDVMDDGEN